MGTTAAGSFRGNASWSSICPQRLAFAKPRILVLRKMDDLLRTILPIFDSIPAAAWLVAVFWAGFLAALLIQWLWRKLHRPRLRVGFDYSPAYIRPTEVTFSDNEKINSYYIRISVTNENRTPAKSCRVFLTNIETQVLEGEFEPTDYDDTLQFAWAGQRKGHEYTGIDLPKGIKLYLNLLTTVENDEKFYLHLQRVPMKYAELFRKKQLFSFDILVTSANMNPQKARMLFQWNGSWDDFKVKIDTGLD
jgi:hypothetical protein